MLDLHEGVDSDDHVCSFSPGNGNSVITRTTDFKFWEDQIREGNENYEEDHYTAYSPPLWSRNSGNGAPLARLNHHSSYPSPTSRFKATASFKKEPVELVPNVPELSYELSLRDIVSDEQSSNEAVQKGITKLNVGKIMIAQAIPKAKKNRKNLKRRQISRSESMDSGAFLLKMFLPTSLCSNKKPAEKNTSNVVRSPSFDGFLKAVNTDWWKIKLLSDNKNSSRSSSSGSSRGSISSTQSCREAENEINVKPGCWSFSATRDCKPKSQSRCLLF